MKNFLFTLTLFLSITSLSQDTIKAPNNLFPCFTPCSETDKNFIQVEDMLGRAHFLMNKKWELIDSSNVNLNYSIKPRGVKAPTEFRLKFLASKNLEEITKAIQETTKEKGKSIESIKINGQKAIIVHDSTNYFCCDFPFFVKSLFIPVGKDLAVFNFSCQNKRKKECLCQFKKIVNSIYLTPTIDIVDSINLPSFQFTINHNQEISDLNQEIKNKLDSIIPFLLKKPNLKLDIGVHYTNNKRLTYSTKSSMTLAFSIQHYLKDHKVKNTLIPVAYGDSEPIEFKLFSPKNNRVEFKILRK